MAQRIQKLAQIIARLRLVRIRPKEVREALAQVGRIPVEGKEGNEGLQTPTVEAV